jgi:NTE family protein
VPSPSIPPAVGACADRTCGTRGTRGTRRLWLAAASALPLAGCSLPFDTDHSGADAPAVAPLQRPARVAWVFGSGGPRGFVHVGVLKALDALGLKPDLVVGSSVGALVGVLYASGRDGQALERLALDLQPWTMGALALGRAERFSGDPLARWVREQLPRPLLEQQALPVVCVARRLSDGEVVGFNRGDAGLAVQASAAVEGQFTPVQIRGTPHVDADRAMPLPVRLAKRLGALRVLAVDASAHEDKAPASAERFREADLRKRALIRPDAAAADLLLHPEFGYWISLTREFREHCIAAGFAATMAQADALRRLHAG